MKHVRQYFTSGAKAEAVLVCELSGADMCRLVLGVVPNFSAMGVPIIKEAGEYRDNSTHGWIWTRAVLETYSIATLLVIYNMCVASWED